MSTTSSLADENDYDPFGSVDNVYSRLETTLRCISTENINYEEHIYQLTEELRRKDALIQDKNHTINSLSMEKEAWSADMLKAGEIVRSLETEVSKLRPALEASMTFQDVIDKMDTQIELIQHSNDDLIEYQHQLEQSFGQQAELVKEKEDLVAILNERLIAAERDTVNARGETEVALEAKLKSHFEFQKQIEAMTCETNQLSQLVKDRDDLLAALKQEVATAQLDAAQAKEELDEAVEAKKNSDVEFKNEIDTITADNSKLSEFVKEQEDLLTKLKDDVAAAEHDAAKAKEELNEVVVEFTKKIEAKTEENIKLSELVKQQQDLLTRLKEDIAVVERDAVTTKDELHKAIEAKKKSDLELKQEIETITVENNKLAELVKEQQDLVATLKEDAATAKIEAAEAKRESDLEFNGKIDTMTSTNAALSEQRKELQDLVTKLKEDVAAAERVAAMAKYELDEAVEARKKSDLEFKGKIDTMTIANAALSEQIKEERDLVTKLKGDVAAAELVAAKAKYELDEAVEARKKSDLEFQRKIETITGENCKLSELVKEQQDLMTTLKEGIAAAERDAVKANAETVEAKKNSDLEFEKKIETIAGENRKLFELVKEQQYLLTKLKEDVAAAEVAAAKAKDDLDEAVEAKKNSDEEFQKKIETISGENTKLSELVKEQQDLITTLKEDAATAKLDLTKGKDELNEAAEAKKKSEVELKRKIDTLTSANGRLSQQLLKQTELVESLKQRIKAVETQVTDVAKAKDERYDALAEIKEFSDLEFQGKITAVTAENTKLTEQVKKLQLELATVGRKLKSSEARNMELLTQESPAHSRLQRQQSLPPRVARPPQFQLPAPSSDDESSASDIAIVNTVNKVAQGMSTLQVQSPAAKRDGSVPLTSESPFKKTKPEAGPNAAPLTPTPDRSTVRRFFRRNPVAQTTPVPKALPGSRRGRKQ